VLKATLRSLFAYKLRLALTALSIILAVAFVAGTFIFTDSLQRAFNDLTSSRQADLIVEPRTEFDSQFSADSKPLTMPIGIAAKVAAVPGAAQAVPWVQVRNVNVLGEDGKPVGGSAGPQSAGIGESWIASPQLAQWELQQGRPPVGPSEVAIDEKTAEKTGTTLGEKITILLPSGARVEPTVSGIAKATLSGGGPGATLVAWELPTAERLLTAPGQISQVRVQAATGVSQQELKTRVDAVLPKDITSQTGDEVSADFSKQLNERLGFLNTFLLVFALISLFVAAFLIYNTFSILVAQRTRELALMRAIGATRRQVNVAVLVEAAVVALIATSVGLLAGVGVALGLRGLFSAAGAPLPGSGLVFLPRTFLVAYGIGLVVTLVSAFVPARRASGIPPVAALREDVNQPAKSLLTRSLVGLGLLVLAAGFAWAGLTTTDDGTRAAGLLGVSALAALIGALALAPWAARVVIPALSWPFSRSTVGRLARENARRNPRRTAATAGALMIGLTLISALSVIASSTTKSTDALVDDVIGADFIVLGANFQPFPPTVYPAVKDTPGIGVATYVRSAVAVLPGGDRQGSIVTVVDPAKIGEVLNITMSSGRVLDLETPGTVIIDTKKAAEANLGIGTTVDVLTLKGPQRVTVVGLYEPAGFFQGFATGYDTGRQLGAPDLDTAIYLTVAEGADPAAVRADLDARLKAFPTATLQDQSEFKADIRDQINQLLVFILALLVLAVFIAFLGIVNTLALSVFERTREIGLLRAVGATRPQIRRMILIESVLIAILGSGLGLVLGVLYGVGLQRTLADDGISKLGIDVPQLAIFLVVSAVGGVVAALWPAWRASRLDVLKAISSE
jgi:putative ABC transport system permease protein